MLLEKRRSLKKINYLRVNFFGFFDRIRFFAFHSIFGTFLFLVRIYLLFCAGFSSFEDHPSASAGSLINCEWCDDLVFILIHVESPEEIWIPGFGSSAVRGVSQGCLLLNIFLVKKMFEGLGSEMKWNELNPSYFLGKIKYLCYSEDPHPLGPP